VHIWVKPYTTINLNILELVSILSLSISALAGVFFVTDDTNNEGAFKTKDGFTLETYEETILYLGFILSNLGFFVYWFVLYILEIRRFIRVKWPKIYHTIFL